MRVHAVILYTNTKDLQSIGAMEAMTHQVIDSLKRDGKEVRTQSQTSKGKMYTFSDGSTLSVLPFGNAVIGMRITHLYVDETVKLMPNAKTYLNEAVTPFILQHPIGTEEMGYADLNLRGLREERIRYYGIHNKTIQLTEFE